MTISELIDMMISERSNMTKKNNGLLKTIKSFFASISDETIRSYYYNTDGENMFEDLQKDLIEFRDVTIPDNLKRIRELKQKNGLNTEQIQKLDDIEKDAEEGLKILDDTQNIIENIMKKERLNPAIMGTLEKLARATVKKHNILPENAIQSSVLHEKYDGDGGFHNRKNKTNNKTYAKKTAHKRPKKRVSNKKKTRKMKKNYL